MFLPTWVTVITAFALHNSAETPERARLPSYGIGHHMLWGTAGEFRRRGVQVLMAKELRPGSPSR